MSHMCKDYVLLLLLLLLQLQLGIVEARCNRPDDLANGAITIRRNFLRFRCYTNYVLLGRTSLTCGISGRLSGERPFCARPGCVRPPDPDDGEIELQRGLTAVVICKENFVVAGNPLAYCNGNTWDRQLGGCRHRNHSESHACDFESEDLCGWTTQLGLMQPWRRISTVGHFHSYRTGPRHDHTLQHAYGGHYMLMESSDFNFGASHFSSPIYARELSLKTACCFRFHYFMYGTGVGTLMVSVKPHQMRLDEMWEYRALYQKFKISGNQGNNWLEHTISIDEMTQDFQVIFTVTDASGQFGDVAIDDVKLMTGKECGGGDYTTTTEEPVKETAEPVAWDTMSCKGRCNMTAPEEDVMLQVYLLMSCGCDEQCVDVENCCSDYMITCLLTDEDTTTIATTTTAKPTTTTTTTRRTTTPKPTTTLRTTTPKPTTTTTVATTTTTRKPTTRRTTVTTTTTRRTTTTTIKPTTTTTKATTTRRTTPRRIEIKTTTPVTPTTTTRRTNSTTTLKPTTTKTTSRSTLPHDIAAATTPHYPNHFTWTVNSDDLEGDFGKQNSSNSARFMWFFMLSIMLIIVLASVIYRWKKPNGAIIEKAVSFQKTLAKLKNVKLPRGNRIGRSEASAPLCDNAEDNDIDDAVQIEEMGVDIRNVTEL